MSNQVFSNGSSKYIPSDKITTNGTITGAFSPVQPFVASCTMSNNIVQLNWNTAQYVSTLNSLILQTSAVIPNGMRPNSIRKYIAPCLVGVADDAAIITIGTDGTIIFNRQNASAYPIGTLLGPYASCVTYSIN